MQKIAFHLNCLARAGAERVVTNLAAQFVQEGYEVVIATEWKDKVEYEQDPRVRRVIVGPEGEEEKKGRIAKIFLRYFKLRRFVKRERPDVLIAFGHKANYRALIATLLMKQKVVVCVRTDPTGHYDGKTDQILIPLLFPRAAGFVFQTTGQRDFFPPFVRKNSTIILNPVNPKYFGLPKPQKREKEVVHSGRLVDFKNHPLLIRAFARVHEKHPDYVLKLYGADSGDGTLQIIETLIDQLHAKDWIKLMGGSDELEKLLPSAAVYAFSSDWEGLPNGVLEAMAMGIPTVATDCPCGGPATVIRNGENGLLVPIMNEEALADAICRLIEDPDFAGRLGDNARKIEELTNPEAVFVRWKEYLESL